MLLEMTGINRDFPQGKETVHVLKNINLTVEEGEYIAIMGPSGSGKSTLMNIMGCLDVPTSGSYILDGENVDEASENRLAEILMDREKVDHDQFVAVMEGEKSAETDQAAQAEPENN